MKTIIQKQGNSAWIKLPNEAIEELNLQENTLLEISINDNKLIIKKQENSMEALCQKITDENLNIYNDFSKIGKEW